MRHQLTGFPLAIFRTAAVGGPTGIDQHCFFSTRVAGGGLCGIPHDGVVAEDVIGFDSTERRSDEVSGMDLGRPKASRDRTFPTRLLLQRQQAIGTRVGRRALSPRSQAVLVLHWFLEGIRITQLAMDNRIGVSTCYRYLHEAVAVLACCAPDIHEALMATVAFGATRVNLDGTLICTDRLAVKSPSGSDLWWSGEHHRHGGNIQIV